MSSNEMRVELEAFVNQGILEGWQGWPLKGQSGCRHEGVRSICYAAGMGQFSRRVSGQAFRAGERFPGRLGDFLR